MKVRSMTKFSDRSRLFRAIAMSWFVLLFTVFVTRCYASISLPIVDEEVRAALDGRICAYGDIDKDHYMDLIVQRKQVLVILSQSEQGAFAEADKFGRPGVGDVGDVFCSVGDFDGNAGLDILISYKKGDAWEASIFLYVGGNFNLHPLLATDGHSRQRFYDQPTVMDVNGDGMADVVGFVHDEGDASADLPASEHRLYCLAGDRGGYTNFHSCWELFDGYVNDRPMPSFAPIFADMDGDLGAEIVFAYQTDKKRRLDVWKLKHDEYIWVRNESLSKDLPESAQSQYIGGPVVSDFNADACLDILIPLCGDEACRTISNMLMLSNFVWSTFQIDMQDHKIVADTASNTLFRVGDFSLDGYPDLVATLKKDDGKAIPMVINNIDYSEKSTFDRRFELSTKVSIILPAEMLSGEVQLSSFFDLKEDGNLDVLVEYSYTDSKTGVIQPKIDFIRCDDKGDTTFLKVQIFSNVCTTDCPGQPAHTADIGSGIAWHGACVSYTMTDSWGGSKVSTQCQIPQSSHRTLYSAFALFGLGRSPNFVDEVNLGSPRLIQQDNQRSVLKQIVPNSRILVVPPEGNGTHWRSRLYLTPSRLIIQSVLVLSSVCGILLLLVILLHFRERRQDLKERQAQTHRFHFDAM